MFFKKRVKLLKRLVCYTDATGTGKNPSGTDLKLVCSEIFSNNANANGKVQD